jgi:hypothetical protein
VHWHYGGATCKKSAIIANQLRFHRDQTLLSYITNNELLYFYSALVTGWRFYEYRHIANALTLAAITEISQESKLISQD